MTAALRATREPLTMTSMRRQAAMTVLLTAAALGCRAGDDPPDGPPRAPAAPASPAGAPSGSDAAAAGASPAGSTSSGLPAAAPAASRPLLVPVPAWSPRPPRPRAVPPPAPRAAAAASSTPPDGQPAQFAADAKWDLAGYNNNEIIYTIFITSQDSRILHCTAVLKGFFYENGEKHSVSDRQSTTVFPQQRVQAGNWQGMDKQSGVDYSVKCHPM